jgi:hypothetical protein
VLCTGNDFAATDITVVRPRPTAAEGCPPGGGFWPPLPRPALPRRSWPVALARRRPSG